jgi:hypothetical protein
MCDAIEGFFSGFTGSAAVETYLLGHAGRPPSAYMGAKTQYRSAILGAMGLRFGQGARRMVLCDGGPWGLVWRVLATVGGADAVAARLRSWSGEDPRALWERLAREPVPGDAVETAARFLALQCGGANSKPVGCTGASWKVHGYGHLSDTARRKGFRDRLLVDEVAKRIAPMPPGLEVVNADIANALALLPEDLAGWYAYLDPPYVGCTPYALDCSRPRVVGIAMDLARRGAVVAVSEGVPVEELTAAGWHALGIGHVRRSQRWTARQAGEWLTMNRAPAAVLASQERLFE